MANHGRPYTREEDLDNYLAERVYPALYERLDSAFPALNSSSGLASDRPPAFPGKRWLQDSQPSMIRSDPNGTSASTATYSTGQG